MIDHPIDPIDAPIDEALPAYVGRALTEYLAVRHAGMADQAPSFGSAVASLAEFVLGGGKRLRPTFAWWGWRGSGGAGSGEEAEAVLRAVSALELIQACALVHDDREFRPELELQTFQQLAEKAQ